MEDFFSQRFFLKKAIWQWFSNGSLVNFIVLKEKIDKIDVVYSNYRLKERRLYEEREKIAKRK